MPRNLTEGTSMKDQAALLRAARKALKVNSEELAEMLGVALPTLRNWIAPPTSKVHREMPKTARLLLARIMAERRKGK